MKFFSRKILFITFAIFSFLLLLKQLGASLAVGWKTKRKATTSKSDTFQVDTNLHLEGARIKPPRRWTSFRWKPESGWFVWDGNAGPWSNAKSTFGGNDWPEVWLGSVKVEER